MAAAMVALVALAAAPAAAAPTEIDSCTTITEPGRYELVRDVSYETVADDATGCIEIRSSDVVFDGGGHEIRGPFSPTISDAAGIAIDAPTPLENVTVTNVRVAEATDGIAIANTTNGSVTDVTIRESFYAGLFLSNASGLTVANATVTRNEQGLFAVSGSTNNTVVDSNFSSNGLGIFLDGSHYNTIARTNVSNSGGGDIPGGIVLTGADGNVIDDNTIAGTDWHGVTISGSSGNAVTNNTIGENWRSGIYLDDARDNRIVGNAIVDNVVGENSDAGIILDASRGATTGNQFYDNYFENTRNVQFRNGAGTDPNAWNVTPQNGTNIVGGSTVAGNYYATPNGTGVSQTCADDDGDGLCDTPAAHSEPDNVDAHPLTDAAGSAPNATFDYSPSDPVVGQSVTFDASASTDADDGIERYEWDFDGDGGTDATGVTVERAFERTGAQPVVLTVTDSAGRTATATETVTVAEPAARLPGDADGDGALTSMDATLVLRAAVGDADAAALVAPDANGDGEVTPLDATRILRSVVGVIE